MKFCSSILAICALAPAGNAFMVQPPKTVSQQTLKAENSYSYLGNLNGDDVKTKTTVASSTSANSVSSTPAGAMKKSASSPAASSITKYDKPMSTKEIFNNITPVTVQGGSLRTCSFDESVDRVTVYLKTEGRPLNANVELWQGPDNSPQKMSVWVRRMY